MDMFMTLFTESIYIEPMLLQITPMMIVFGWFWATKTFMGFCRSHLAVRNGVVYCIDSLNAFWMTACVSPTLGAIYSLAVLCLRSSLFTGVVGLFSFFRSTPTCLAFGLTRSALRKKAILKSFAFREPIQKFLLFARAATLCYDGFKHDRFSYKRLCSEPLASYALVGGLSHYQQQPSYVKEDF